MQSLTQTDHFNCTTPEASCPGALFVPNLYHPTNREQTAGCIEELGAIFGSVYESALWFRLALYLAHIGDLFYLGEVVETLRKRPLPNAVLAHIEKVERLVHAPDDNQSDVTAALCEVLDELLWLDSGSHLCGDGFICWRRRGFNDGLYSKA